MANFLKDAMRVSVPVFVVFTMLNLGLTHTISEILGYLNRVGFVVKVLVANFVVAPLIMIAILEVATFHRDLKMGLVIFGLCAGAPFLIKLTSNAHQDVALGAALMLLLMVVTVAYVPIVLPRLDSALAVDPWAIVRSLITQMIAPIAVGMVVVQFLPAVARAIQPTVGRFGNIMLYVVIATSIGGYFKDVLHVVGSGAILASLLFVLGSFGAGYVAGLGSEALEDVGALATAQRNTAAGMIIATQNFSDRPMVMVMITIANSLGILMLMGLARLLGRRADDHRGAEPAPAG